MLILLWGIFIMSDENGDGIVVVMLIISTAFIVGAMFCFAFNIDISNETNIIETHYINDTFFMMKMQMFIVGILINI